MIETLSQAEWEATSKFTSLSLFIATVLFEVVELFYESATLRSVSPVGIMRTI